MTNTTRTARINNKPYDGLRKKVDAYLPDNYATVIVNSQDSETSDYLRIVGIDVAGWTLDEYVIPRLASDLIFAEEVQ